MTTLFDQCFEKLIGNEGGYTPGKGDPGGETKFGVSKRSYPALEISSLTLDDAKAIYMRDFWTPAGCDSVPTSIAFDLFDMAVNSGVSRAVKTLQRVAGTAEDGKLGPVTLAAVAQLDPVRAVAWFNGVRLSFMVSLDVWPTFSRGWALRISDNLMGA